MQNTLSEEQLDALFQASKDIVMHPEFQAVVAEIQSSPPSERWNKASTQLTSQALAAKGVPISKDLNITVQASKYSTDSPPSAANVAETGQDTTGWSGPHIETKVCIVPFLVYKTASSLPNVEVTIPIV